MAIIFTSAAVPQVGARGMNAAEKWVVNAGDGGEIADLKKKFLEEKDRKAQRAFSPGFASGHAARIQTASTRRATYWGDLPEILIFWDVRPGISLKQLWHTAN